MRRLLLFFLPAWLAGCASTIDLQAHRGGRGLMPENTLPAFENALRLGVTTLELDTGITRDGVVVIGHDPVLNPDIVRGPDGRWLENRGPAIHSLTYAQLLQYDIGRLNPASAYGKRYPQQQAVDGTRYPRLTDLFALVQRSEYRHIRLNIETKLSPFERDLTVGPEAFVEALLAVIRAGDMADRVTLQSFDWRTLQIAQQQAPSIATVYLSVQQKFFDNINAGGREGSAWTAGLNAQDFGGSVARMVKAAGGAIWSPYFGDVDRDQIRDAQARGLKVVVWTVNQPTDIERVLDDGVDGVVSDYPDRLREAMAKRGMRLPKRP
jgi:glycerophosphoryl diester phosphodiesterase